MNPIKKCPGCGAALSLSRDRRSLACDFCGNTYPVDSSGETPSKDVTDAKLIELYTQAEAFRQKADYSSEIRVLTSALELAPENVLTLNKLGRAYRVMNFTEKALECYERVIEIDPKFGMAYCNMGAAYLRMGDYKKAISCYEKGMELIDKSNRSDYAIVLANYALALGHNGDKRKAAALLNEAEKLGYPNGKAIRQELKLSRFSVLFS